MWGMGMASSYQSCILRPEQRWMRGHIWCGANCWPGHHITITSYLSPSQVSWTWSTSDSGLVLVVTWCVVWQKMGMVHYKKRTVKPESNPSAKDSWLILEADQFVPRVATIGFCFKLQLNWQRYRQISCTDSKQAAATKQGIEGKIWTQLWSTCNDSGLPASRISCVIICMMHRPLPTIKQIQSLFSTHNSEFQVLFSKSSGLDHIDCKSSLVKK